MSSYRLVKIAYLTNQYPKISHTFIRREIRALEHLGIGVERVAIRGSREQFTDPQDLEEEKRTRVLLDAGAPVLLGAMLMAGIRRPAAFWCALTLAMRVGWQSERGVFVHLIYVIEASLLLRWTREAQVQHIHAHFGTNPAMVAMLCRVLGGPTYSFTVHGAPDFRCAEHLGYEEKVSRSAFVATVSYFCRSQLCQYSRYRDWWKIYIVHCGLDQAFLEQEPVNVPDARQIVCVGRMSAEKGHIVLIEAAAQLKAEGHDFEVVLVGDGEMRPEIERLIGRYGLEHSVRITGWLAEEEVRERLLSSRGLVLPSFAEGLPMVIMEAFAMRRPVVATHIAGIPELVVDGENGWLVPAGSEQHLRDALRRMLRTAPGELQRMGDAGREAVRQRHDQQAEAAKLKTLLEADSERLSQRTGI